jgi:hypothetical protein
MFDRTHLIEKEKQELLAQLDLDSVDEQIALPNLMMNTTTTTSTTNTTDNNAIKIKKQTTMTTTTNDKDKLLAKLNDKSSQRNFILNLLGEKVICTLSDGRTASGRFICLDRL